VAAGPVLLGLWWLLGRSPAADSGPARAGQGTAAAAAGLPASTAGADQAIRDSAREFTRAFNAGDASAIGKLWAADAEYTDERGEVFRGREAIENAYAQLFAQQHGVTMAVTIESIRFLGPLVASEKGIAQVTPASGDAPTATRYTVVHINREGKWLMAVGHEVPYVPGANEDYLKDLQWLIGRWNAASTAHPLQLNYEWMAQRNFIENTYTIGKGDADAASGRQIIGWNAKLGRIVSWHFHSDGGVGSDVWIKDGPKWVIEATGFSRDGSQSAALNVLTPIDANTYTWQSIKRTLDGVSLPDTPPVKLVRVRPADEAAK
jgi:uncharacterized protein (TIGR02246 family)